MAESAVVPRRDIRLRERCFSCWLLYRTRKALKEPSRAQRPNKRSFAKDTRKATSKKKCKYNLGALRSVYRAGSVCPSGALRAHHGDGASFQIQLFSTYGPNRSRFVALAIHDWEGIHA